MIKRFLIILMSITLFSCSPKTNEDKRLSESLQKSLDTLREEYHIPGAVLLVKTPDFEGVFTTGQTAFERGKPITSNTLFSIGSITKTFISTLILKLESEDKLSIHDPLSKYLPQYSRWENITIEQLLDMTSGINNYTNDDKFKNDLEQHFKQDWNSDLLIDMAYQYPDDFKPGTNWNYTNTAYLLLGKIIEKVTNESVSDALNDHFFKPLNMQHAFFGINGYPPSVFNQIALGYYNGVIMSPTLLTNLGPASGGMVMSANDLAIWLEHLFIKKDLLPEKQFNEMLTPATKSLGKMRPTSAQFAKGLGVFDDEEMGKMYSFTGVTPTGTAMYLWIPKKQTLMIAMATLDRHGDKDYDIFFLDKPFVKNILSSLEGHYGN